MTPVRLTLDFWCVISAGSRLWQGKVKMAAWITYRGLDIFRPAGSAYVYTTAQMEIDAHGAPQAYHPADTGLDPLANAGFPGGGCPSVLVAEPHSARKTLLPRTAPT